MTELIVPRRFCGPPDSANGGWTAGALAGLLTEAGSPQHDGSGQVVEVSLRRPPPLDTPMPVSTDDGALTASSGDGPVATARSSTAVLSEVEPVDADTARAAQQSYPGLSFHPFPTCFACGTQREEGDGLRIWPGLVDAGSTGRQRVAATWVPHASLAVEGHEAGDETPRASIATTWAALDCIGGWAGDLTERLMVLGRMTTRVDALPVIGEEHVVVGELRGMDGRKTYTATTLRDADGRVVASSEHVWIAVDPELFGGQAPRK